MSNVHKEGQVATVPVEHCRDETTSAITLAIAAASRPDGPGIGLHMKANSAHTLGCCEHVKEHKYVHAHRCQCATYLLEVPQRYVRHFLSYLLCLWIAQLSCQKS